jgi:hypothetical protein
MIFSLPIKSDLARWCSWLSRQSNKALALGHTEGPEFKPRLSQTCVRALPFCCWSVVVVVVQREVDVYELRGAAHSFWHHGEVETIIFGLRNVKNIKERDKYYWLYD